MNAKQEYALRMRDTDLQGAMRRLGGDEDLYIDCLRLFLEDPTMAQFNEALDNRDWDGAFTAAHAMKGLAGNMGFVPLMHSTGQLIIVIRAGRMHEIGDCMARVNSSYRDISDAIRGSFSAEIDDTNKQDEVKGDDYESRE